MKGKLYIIGLGPGDLNNMTVRALNCIKQCDVLIGYTVYINLIVELTKDKEIIRKAMGQEIERCRIALNKAAEGKTVGMVCSGDAGLYGMAGLILQMHNGSEHKETVDIEIIPGITAALSCSSLLGAPITEDFCTISLSDYMINWDKIVRRLEKACEGDFVIALYNPKSAARPENLKKAIEIVLRYRLADTPVGIVRNAYRREQTIVVTKLKDLDFEAVDMLCTVIVGNSQSFNLNGNIITARGYEI